MQLADRLGISAPLGPCLIGSILLHEELLQLVVIDFDIAFAWVLALSHCLHLLLHLLQLSQTLRMLLLRTQHGLYSVWLSLGISALIVVRFFGGFRVQARKHLLLRHALGELLRLSLALRLHLLRLLRRVEVLHARVLDQLLGEVVVLSAVGVHHTVYVFDLDVFLLIFADDCSVLSLRL